MTNDNKTIVEGFNKFFVEIGPNLAKQIPATNLESTSLLPPSSNESLVLLPTDPVEVKSIIISLKNSSACGVDQIPISVIKSVIEHISPILASLINFSLQEGIFPNALKVAKILPVYKSGNHMHITNYRPISLLNCFSKIYEKVLYNRLEKFFEKQQTLYDQQYGFRKNRSTQLTLISFIDNLTEAIDKNEYAISIFIDLSKAFDTIDHSILMKKLYNYGIRGLANDIFKNYLSNRFQGVTVGRITSTLESISCGVPQDSILGPILFLLYINDIYRCSALLQFFLFADDTTILYSSKNIVELIDTVNKELLTLTDWFRANKLSLNVSKTNYIIFQNYKTNFINPDVILDSKAITKVQSTKFLGVEIEYKLTWKDHIQIVEKKISFAIFIIKKLYIK